MLNFKKIFIPFVTMILFCSCIEQKLLFNVDSDVNFNFFKAIPGIGPVTYNGLPVIKKAADVEIYLSSFSEKYIEKDRLLEFTELNDSTQTPFVNYLGITGYSQTLYLLKYTFTYSATSKKTGKTSAVPVKAALYFSVKQNGTGNIIGVVPCYFGIINDEDDLIAFDTQLQFQQNKSQPYLQLIKRNKKLNGLLFMPADFPANPKTAEDKFNIEKIVRLDPNKVGGYKPLVFDINNIFHDLNALQFHYSGTLHLTQ